MTAMGHSMMQPMFGMHMPGCAGALSWFALGVEFTFLYFSFPFRSVLLKAFRLSRTFRYFVRLWIGKSQRESNETAI